ncbi:hypothetical protein QFC21_002614 [Naganishia friedmannii]|uniref:Uncharacterized protein n=1 Tax=Naganishia friedmannii TaxID=89922 RepID=A0ACC2VVP1_9TREE|nr:hypothetical protein QFC21_002614 [Naganishia friedmannii]
MSRGGFGGGRGGGGRGGFGGLAGPGRAGMEVSTGTLTREDLKETTSVQEHGVLYPRYDKLQHPHLPNEEERRICQYTRDLMQMMHTSPYRLEEKVKKNEIISYADKYRKKTNLTTTSLDAQQLGLEKSFFPERMWTTYFDPKQKVKDKKVVRKKKLAADLDDGDDKEDDDDDGENDSQAGTDVEQDDYDEEEGEDDDYGNNYFDNGEGDEGGEDGGGGDDEGTY